MSLNDAFEILFLLIVFIHLFFGYLLLGGFPMMVITGWLGKREGQVHLKDLGGTMRRVGPTVTVLAISLGILLGPLVYGKFEKPVIQILDTFSIGFGFLVILVIFSFWGVNAYKTKYARITQTPLFHGVVGGGIIVCLLGTSFLFVIMHIMMIHPDHIELIGQTGVLASLSLPTIWPRFLHIVLGSVAATGIVITLYGTLRPYQEDKLKTFEDSPITPFHVQITRYGVGWTLAGTLPQIVIGPWLLLSLPDEVRMRLVDGTSLSSLVFFVSLTFALFALVLLNASLMVPHVRGLVWTGLGSLLLTIVLMVMIREEVRKAWMGSYSEVMPVNDLKVVVVLGVASIAGLGFLVLGRIFKGMK